MSGIINDNKKVLVFWLVIIGVHCVVTLSWALAAPQSPNIGVLVLYVTMAVFSSVGVPVFASSHAGWGWAVPNMLGWALSVFVWLIGYFGIAYAIAKYMKK